MAVATALEQEQQVDLYCCKQLIKKYLFHVGRGVFIILLFIFVFFAPYVRMGERAFEN